jgi:hypothetical protein
MLPTAIAATVGVYLLALAIHAREVIDSMYANADAAAAFVIAELMPHAAAGREVVLGDYNWVEAIWLLRGTAWLPSHFAVWQLLPFAVWGLTVVLVAGAVRLVSTWRAALLAGALVLCVGADAREVFWTLNFHGLVVWHMALLAFGLACLAARPAWLTRPAAIVAAVVLGAVTAVGLQDQMLLVVGVAPLLIAGGAWTWRTGSTRPLLLTGIVAVVAVGLGVVLHQLTTDAGIIRDDRVFVFTPAVQLTNHLGLLPGALGEFVAGDSLGAPVDTFSVIALAGLVLAVTVVVLVAWRGWTLVRTIAREPRGAAAAVPAHVLLIFCAAVVAATCAAWMLNGFLVDTAGSRYLGGLWIAAAAGLALLADTALDRRRFDGVVAAVCLIATIGVLHGIEPTKVSNFPTPRAAAAVRSFAVQHGARIGYAGMWDAFPLTWHSRFAVTLTPIQNCGDPTDGNRNCPPPEHRISSWYHAQPGNPRSFLVVDSSQPLQPSVDPRFGKALAVTTYGPLTILVYDHDIARDVRPPGTRT